MVEWRQKWIESNSVWGSYQSAYHAFGDCNTWDIRKWNVAKTAICSKDPGSVKERKWRNEEVKIKQRFSPWYSHNFQPLKILQVIIVSVFMLLFFHSAWVLYLYPVPDGFCGGRRMKNLALVQTNYNMTTLCHRLSMFQKSSAKHTWKNWYNKLLMAISSDYSESIHDSQLLCWIKSSHQSLYQSRKRSA